MSDEHVCARCPKVLGASCCEVKEGEHLATLTTADVERIRGFARLSPAKFCEEEWLSVEEARAYEERRPLYLGYFRKAPVRLTLRRRDGACVFLDKKSGCALPSDIRPTACLLYPFELWPDGSWSLQVDRFGDDEEAKAAGGSACLAVERASEMEDVLRAFGLTREEVESIGEKLRAEVRGHSQR